MSYACLSYVTILRDRNGVWPYGMEAMADDWSRRVDDTRECIWVPSHSA